MIKRTIYFGNPAYLSLHLDQLLVTLPEVKNNMSVPEAMKKDLKKTIPIEDIGMVVLDHKQITITQGLLEKLVEYNSVILTCDSNHLPVGLLLPMTGNTLQSERYQAQINVSLPLRKQLWQQTIVAKISNQASVLKEAIGCSTKNMDAWADRVKSGDSDNLEARAAVYYWDNLFPEIENFRRDREGIPPNNLLNYGYAILRAAVARSLVCSGLIPTLGIFHHNRYNAYCLADDIMEPYRPYVDQLVKTIVSSGYSYHELSQELKVKLLSLPTLEVKIQNKRRPMMIAISQTTNSLVECYQGLSRKIIYPDL